MRSSCVGAGIVAARLLQFGSSIIDGRTASSPYILYGGLVCLTVVGICTAIVVREFVWFGDSGGFE